MLNNLKQMLNKNSQKFLWLFIFLYTIFFTLISFWKYSNFLYNGLDLAIFNQVFFNTSEGRFFEFSIHPHSYLGDHFIPFILFLTPIYALFKSPLILLFLQSLILGLSAWPVYLISTIILSGNNNNNVILSEAERSRKISSFIPLLISIAFLLNPLLWNINLFEFHILPFAIFFLLFAFYFFLKRKFWLYVIFLLLALTVREDISLVVFMFSFLPFMEITFFDRVGLFARKDIPFKGIIGRKNILKRKFWKFFQLIKGQLINNNYQLTKYFLFPFLVSITWFFSSNVVINYFNPDGSYKFLVYYQWLGESNNSFELLLNILSHPLKIFLHLFSFGSLLVIFIFLLSFIFLPIFAKRYLLLALGPFVQFFLNFVGVGDITYKTHYPALFLPALIISSIYGLRSFLEYFRKIPQISPFDKGGLRGIFKNLIQDKYFLIIFIIATIVYSNLILGPFLGVVKAVTNNEIKDKKTAIETLIDKIPSDASVVTSYNLLPNLSSRQEIYSLHYGFSGKSQFFKDDYKFPKTIDYYLIDFSDIIIYDVQIKDKKAYLSGDDRLRDYLDGYGVVEIIDTLVLFKKDYKSDIKLLDKEAIARSDSNNLSCQMTGKVIPSLNNKIALLGYTKNKKTEQTFGQSSVINYSFIWQALKNIEENYQIELQILDKQNNIVWQKIYPLAYGIYPTSEWGINETVKTNYRFLIPDKFLNKKYQFRINLINIENGYIGLDGLRSAKEIIEEKEKIDSWGLNEN